MRLLRRQEQFAAYRTLRVVGLVLLGLAAFVFCPASSALAQTAQDALVSGQVRNQRGQPVAGALFELLSLDTSQSITLVSGPSGELGSAQLAPGTYRVGFGSATNSLVIAVPPAEFLRMRLTVGPNGLAQAEVLRSAATGPDPEPDENGDGLQSYAGLEPLVAGDIALGSGRDPSPDPDGDPDAAETANGPAQGLSRGRHAGVAYVYSQASVREFRTAGLAYSAATGRSGDVATRLTRSGSQSFHGSALLTLRSQIFAAYEPLAVATAYADGVVTSTAVKPHDLRVAYAAAVGGPVPHARALFFFASLDQQRRGFPAVSSPADPNFYRLSAMQTALLGNRGVTPAATNAGLNFLSSLTGSTPRRADQTLGFGRLDWKLRKTLDLSLEYNGVRWNSPAGLIDAPTVARGRASLGNASGSLDLLLLQVTSQPGHRMSNDARISLTRDLRYETPQSPLPQEPNAGPGGSSPEVNIGPNGLLFGTPASLSQLAYPDERRLRVSDAMTAIGGHHVVQIGVEIALTHDTVATLTNPSGTFHYDSGTTNGKAGGLVDFLTDYAFPATSLPSGGCPSIFSPIHLGCFRTFTQSFGESSVSFVTQDWVAYAQETWRAAPRLTLHAGLRYEYMLLPLPQRPNPSLDAVFGTRGATSVFPEDRNNLGPRIGLTWEPLGSGRGVVRAGYGVYFGRLPGATIQAALSDTAQPAATTRIRIRPATEVTCPQAPTQGFGYPCAFATQPPGVVAPTTSAVVFDRHFRLPTIQQASLSFERSVRHGTTLSATYLLNLDRQLPSSTDLNIAPSTGTATFQLQGGTGVPGVMDGETFRVPLYTGRVSPGFGPVTAIVSHVNANYHALTVALDSRATQTLDLRANFTWAKGIDFGQAQSATPRTNGQFDPFTVGYDKGLSSLNYPFALRFQASWRPHPRLRTRWLRVATNGWDATPILLARSGRPYSLDVSGGTSLPGGHLSLNGSGGALYLPTVGRNTLRLPATANLDLRLSRGLRLTDRLRGRFDAEVFNLLNHQNVTSVQQRAFVVGAAVGGITPLVFQSASAISKEGLTTQAFGASTATGTSLARARRVQFGLRVDF